ncbi:hypothetical protein [Brevibacterium litoralis]|uniref:hypothetical protein n=1 Tax=Brevibacterium litoralis TaxID=3138935 RepID=UPI0032F00D20
MSDPDGHEYFRFPLPLLGASGAEKTDRWFRTAAILSGLLLAGMIVLTVTGIPMRDGDPVDPVLWLVVVAAIAFTGVLGVLRLRVGKARADGIAEDGHASTADTAHIPVTSLVVREKGFETRHGLRVAWTELEKIVVAQGPGDASTPSSAITPWHRSGSTTPSCRPCSPTSTSRAHATASRSNVPRRHPRHDRPGTHGPVPRERVRPGCLSMSNDHYGHEYFRFMEAADHTDRGAAIRRTGFMLIGMGVTGAVIFTAMAFTIFAGEITQWLLLGVAVFDLVAMGFLGYRRVKQGQERSRETVSGPTTTLVVRDQGFETRGGLQVPWTELTQVAVIRTDNPWGEQKGAIIDFTPRDPSALAAQPFEGQWTRPKDDGTLTVSVHGELPRIDALVSHLEQQARRFGLAFSLEGPL